MKKQATLFMQLQVSAIINDMKGCFALVYITERKQVEKIYADLKDVFSPGFDAGRLTKKNWSGNQTTMLASDRHCRFFLKQVMISTYDLNDNVAERLQIQEIHPCYATNDNQTAVCGLLEQPRHCHCRAAINEVKAILQPPCRACIKITKLFY
jgi:4-hydroxy-3-methylbut-2-enyl diphosphate reductase